MAKRKALTSDEINAKKEALKAKVEESKERAKTGVRSSPAMDFLREVKEIVKDALESGVSYKQLSKDIYDTYSFKVSEQSIRAFAHSALGIPKKSRNAKKDTKQTAPENKPKSSSQIKKEIAKKRAAENRKDRL